MRRAVVQPREFIVLPVHNPVAIRIGAGGDQPQLIFPQVAQPVAVVVRRGIVIQGAEPFHFPRVGQAIGIRVEIAGAGDLESAEVVIAVGGFLGLQVHGPVVGHGHAGNAHILLAQFPFVGDGPVALQARAFEAPVDFVAPNLEHRIVARVVVWP